MQFTPKYINKYSENKLNSNCNLLFLFSEISRMKPAVWYLSMLIVAFLYFYVLAIQYIRAAEIPNGHRTIASVLPTYPAHGKKRTLDITCVHSCRIFWC